MNVCKLQATFIMNHRADSILMNGSRFVAFDSSHSEQFHREMLDIYPYTFTATFC